MILHSMINSTLKLQPELFHAEGPEAGKQATEGPGQ